MNSTARAQVGVKSFYYESLDTTLTEYSAEKLDVLVSSLLDHNLQIIELNAFCNKSDTYIGNKNICAERIDYFIERLTANKDEINIGNYGSRRIPINFKVVNWNRIDIYYTLSPKTDVTTISIPDSELVVISPIIDTIPAEITRPIPEHEQIVKEVPISTPIQFKGGKTQISDKSEKYLNRLAKTLESNPELNAHIRGHVCCGPNKRVSKKRAKSVYKALVKRGISKSRLSFDGYSNNLPIVFPEVYERDRKKNRRVDIIFNDQ